MKRSLSPSLWYAGCSEACGDACAGVHCEPAESTEADEPEVKLVAKKRKQNLKKCSFVEGCSKFAMKGGLCIAHGGGKRCQKEGCPKSAKGATDFCIAHGGGKRCQQEKCTKTAQGATNFCISHGGGRRCQMKGCTKGAEDSTIYCSNHGGGKRCQTKGCDKGVQGSTSYCKAHGGGKRCQKEGCTKSAISPTNFCVAHGGGKRCQKDECHKSAAGGSNFCIVHGGGKRCQKNGCTTGAFGSTDFCSKHGGGKRCQMEKCPKAAESGTNFCIAHGGGKRCVGPSKVDDQEQCPYRLSAKNKYDSRCVRCFIAAFPNDARAINAKAFLHFKELTVREFLEATFPQYRWTFDRTCAVGTLFRPDARTALGKTRLLIVEIDEHSHDTNVCDRERERERVFKKHAPRNAVVHVVRFNPDAYDDPVTGVRVPSCFRYSKEEGKASVPPDRKADWESRLDKLRSTIQEIIDHQHEEIQVPELLLEDDRYKYVIPIELFYDNVREKWPDGNKQRKAAYKRNAKVRKAFEAENAGGGSSSVGVVVSDSESDYED